MSNSKEILELIESQSRQSSEQFAKVFNHLNHIEESLESVYDGIVSVYHVDARHKDTMSATIKECEMIKEVIFEHYAMQIEIASLRMMLANGLKSEENIDVEQLQAMKETVLSDAEKSTKGVLSKELFEKHMDRMANFFESGYVLNQTY